VSIGGYYQSCECPVSSASLPFVTYAANGSTEPISPNVAHIINIWSRTKATAIGEHLLTAPENQITTAFDVFALR